MKGLIITFITIVVLIAIGIGVSIIINDDLNDRLVAAHERGFEEGYVQGHEEGSEEGGIAGYQEGSKTGYTKANWKDSNASDEAGFYFAYNPSYVEVLELLAMSEANSAKEIHDCAEANGIRVAYVRVQIARQTAERMVYIYQLVAFETVDRGLIIIEPWSYRKVELEVGKRYSELNGLPPNPHDDTITKITFVW